MGVKTETPPPYGDGPLRPSDEEIIEALSEHFGVPEVEVLEWLARFDARSALLRGGR